MDLEILFCFPYSIALPDIGACGWNGIVFILLLTVVLFMNGQRGIRLVLTFAFFLSFHGCKKRV
jgi:NADH:ubiquinone oxidoreductase subunit 3 (subunit A)